MNFLEIKTQLYSLSIFRNFLNLEVTKKFLEVLDSGHEDEVTYIAKYCSFVSALYKEDTNFSRYVYSFMMNDENIYIQTCAQGNEVSMVLKDALKHDLKVLEMVSMITSSTFLESYPFIGALPKWENTKYEFEDEYCRRIKELPTKGYGVFAKYHVFSIVKDQLVPVKHPDPQRLSSLVGYIRERELIIKNTIAFIQGMQASNALLYGDAGTGKSSTIKALVNEYHDKGLRLIELKKHQLHQLPDIIDMLARNPLKFIIFIDDLSFSGNDDNFIALKTLLEGGVSKHSMNIVIYATSNRRHLVKESMKDRNQDELFTNDSIQETMSLAARFGLTITFSKPNKDLYLEIVDALAQKNKLDLSGEELIIKAEAFAIRNNGRSPRTAKQFIELEKIKEMIK